jgi:hypothetical protein
VLVIVIVLYEDVRRLIVIKIVLFYDFFWHCVAWCQTTLKMTNTFCGLNLILLLQVYVIMLLEVELPLRMINNTLLLPSYIKINIYLLEFETLISLQ